MLKLIFTCIAIASLHCLSAQKVVINNKEGNRLLQWNDFKGTPDENSSYFAYTAYNTKFKFDNVAFNGDKAILKGFEMTLEFDPQKSWVKKGKESDALLKHEQGHFDVGLLHLQDVIKRVAETSFTRTGFKEEFRQLMNEIHQKYRDMGLQYDKETDHSIKKEEQEKWNQFFDKEVVR